jgi:hypothetical protein
MEEEAELEKQREELRQAILDQEQEVSTDVSVVHIGYLCAGPKRCDDCDLTTVLAKG